MSNHAEAPASSRLRDASAGSEGNPYPVVPPQKLPFTWTGRDVADTSFIAFQLGLMGRSELSDALLETSIELQCRRPRPADAWRYFEAARGLRPVFRPSVRRIAQRIALEVIGAEVIDGHFVEAGSSAAYVFGLVRPFEDDPLRCRQVGIVARSGNDDDDAQRRYDEVASEHFGETLREPTADERAGMQWWNALPESKRGEWLQRSGGQSAADAWSCFKRFHVADFPRPMGAR